MTQRVIFIGKKGTCFEISIFKNSTIHVGDIYETEEELKRLKACLSLPIASH